MKRLIILALAALGLAAGTPNAEARNRRDHDGDRVVVIRDGRGSHYHGDRHYRTYRGDRYYRTHRYDRYDRYDDDYDRYERRSLPRRIVHRIFDRIF